MMNKFFLTFFLCLSGFAVSAQHTAKISYSGGLINKESGFLIKGRGQAEAAIYLPARLLSGYAGASLSGVAVGFTTRKNVETLRVWVRSSLTGENLAEGQITSKEGQTIIQGRNVVAFTKPYTLKANEDLYVGYTYQHRDKTNAVSIIPGRLENSCFIKVAENAAWEDKHAEGVLSVEALVDAAALPAYDLGLLETQVEGCPAKDSVFVRAFVCNPGTKRVQGFELSVKERQTGRVFKHRFSMPISQGGVTQAEIGLAATHDAASGKHDWDVSISDLSDGNKDAIAANNSAAAKFSFLKSVAIEEFTTQHCRNCPRVSGYLKQVLSKEAFRDRAVVLCHHAGFQTDVFTIDADKAYTWFYNQDGLYAPAVMYDRFPFFKTDTKGLPTPLHTPELSDIEKYLSKRLLVPSNNYPAVKQVRVDGDRLDFDVEIFRLPTSEKAPDRLTVFLLEDSIEAPQAGAPDAQHYKHMHVGRSVNETWGESIDPAGGNVIRHYSFDLNPSWNRKNLAIVALIGYYNENNIAECFIDNATIYRLSEISTGIGEITTDQKSTASQKAFYDLNGRQISADHLSAGIYIVREQAPNGSVKTSKIIVR